MFASNRNLEGGLSGYKPVGAWVLVGWIVLFTVLLPWENRLQADDSKPLITTIREALTERLLVKTGGSSLQKNQITSAHVRTVVHDNLDPGLLTSVTEATGTDFRFVPSGRDTEAQVAILILAYPDKKTVLSMAKKLAPLNGYFRHTKIFTRFSYASLANRLVIAFTENAGNEEVVEFINECPELLKTVACGASLENEPYL